MSFRVIPSVAALVFMWTGSAAGQQPDLGGAWLLSGSAAQGQACQIVQDGGALTFVNERNERSPGRFVDARTVVATGWGDLRGAIADGGMRIDWANGTWWSRYPALQGSWGMQGGTGAGTTCQILQASGELTFVNERGDRSPGRFIDARTVVATGWGDLRGALVDGGRRIDWANGTWWARR
ncbi:MAG: hypothetical protein ACYC6F_17165 [Longimicrobiales bacterium]